VHTTYNMPCSVVTRKVDGRLCCRQSPAGVWVSTEDVLFVWDGINDESPQSTRTDPCCRRSHRTRQTDLSISRRQVRRYFLRLI